MTQSLRASEAAVDGGSFALTPQQVAYFETFGFLKVPELFRDDVSQLVSGFEEVFANEQSPRMETHEHLHLDERRVIIPCVHPQEREAQATPRRSSGRGCRDGTHGPGLRVRRE